MQAFKIGDWKRRKVVGDIRNVLRLDYLVLELRAASAFDGENRLGEAIELTETFRNQLISRLTPVYLKDVVKAIAQCVSNSESVTYGKVLQEFDDDFHDDRQLLDWCKQWTQIDDAHRHGDSIDLRLKSIIERSLLGLRWARQCESGLRAALRGATMAPLLRELEVANGAAMLCLSQLNGFLPRYLFGQTRRWLRDHHEPMMKLLKHNRSTLRHILAEAPETALATRLTAIERCLSSLDDSSQSNREPIAASVKDYFISLYKSNDSQLHDAMDGLEPKFCYALSGASAEEIEVKEERDLRLRCILLVIRTWDRVAQSQQIPKTIWKLTDAWASQLASTADEKITIIGASHIQQTDENANMNSGAFQAFEVELSEPEKSAGLLAAGLVAESVSGTRVIVPAKFSRPRKVPKLYWMLHHMQKLTNPGMGVLCSTCHKVKVLIGQSPSAATLKQWFEVADETSVASCKGAIEKLIHELVLATTLPGSDWSESERYALSSLQDALIAEGVKFRSATSEELRHGASVRLCRGIPIPGRKSVVISWFADQPTTPHLLVSAGVDNTGPLVIWLADHWDRIELLRTKTPQWEQWRLMDQYRLAVFDHQGCEDKSAMTRRVAWQLF